MATIFNDTFTETSDTTLASHTPDTGTSWTLLISTGTPAGTLQVDGTADTLISEDGALSDGCVYTADATYSTANYQVSCDVVVADSADDTQHLHIRVQDTNNMYALYFNEDVFQLYKKVSGSWSTLGADQGAVVVDTDSVYLKAVGSTISAGVNSVEQVSVTDSDISSAGKAGYGQGAEIGGTDDMGSCEIDNYLVETVSGGVTVTANTLTSTSSQPTPQINLGTSTTVNTLSLTTSTITPSVGEFQTLTQNTLTLTTSQPTISVITNYTQTVNTLTLTASTVSPNIIAAFTVNTQTLTSSTVTPTVLNDYTVQVGTQSATISIVSPTVQIFGWTTVQKQSSNWQSAEQTETAYTGVNAATSNWKQQSQDTTEWTKKDPETTIWR